MAEQYDISLKNTFLHFVSHEASAEGKSLFRSRSASCPCLYFKGVAAKSGHARLEQDVLSPHAGYVEKGTGKEQSQSKSHDSGSWRKINHELIEAARKGTYDKILSVVHKKFDEMNGINFATAFHRLARGVSTDFGAVLQDSIFLNMLDAVKKIANQELQQGGGHLLSASCSSIVAWSCATLGAFRLPLFARLAEVAARQLHSCQDYEVTNLLWAFGQLKNSQPEMAAELAAQIRGLLGAAANVCTRERLCGMKAHVLVSALVSLATLQGTGRAARLLGDVSAELGRRWQELSAQSKTQISIAHQLMQTRKASWKLLRKFHTN
ncbi:unnamed protein product [Effrenium voratum]|nr:unnamed protein product [Effrenium voratum]